jgi:hypothetical protein
VICIEYRHEQKAFNRGIIRPPDKPNVWLFVFGILGAGLVAIGVAGEFWIHVKAGKLEADMREANRQLVALVDERASKNEREAAKLRKAAAGLEKQAEDERMARAELEDRVAWRRLTKDQQSVVASTLWIFAGERAIFGYDAGNVEALLFATDIEKTLEAARWRVFSPAGMVRFKVAGKIGVIPEPLPTGVGVESSLDLRSINAAKALVSGLQSLGFDAANNGATQKDAPEVLIYVDPRPEGPQGKAKLRPQKNNKTK